MRLLLIVQYLFSVGKVWLIHLYTCVCKQPSHLGMQIETFGFTQLMYIVVSLSPTVLQRLVVLYHFWRGQQSAASALQDQRTESQTK